MMETFKIMNIICCSLQYFMIFLYNSCEVDVLCRCIQPLSDFCFTCLFFVMALTCKKLLTLLSPLHVYSIVTGAGSNILYDTVFLQLHVVKAIWAIFQLHFSNKLHKHFLVHHIACPLNPCHLFLHRVRHPPQ